MKNRKIRAQSGKLRHGKTKTQRVEKKKATGKETKTHTKARKEGTLKKKW